METMRKKGFIKRAIVMLLVCVMTVGIVSADDIINNEDIHGIAYILKWRGRNVYEFPGRKFDIYRSAQTFFRRQGDVSVIFEHAAGKTETLAATMTVTVYKESAQQFSLSAGVSGTIPGLVTVAGEIGYNNWGLKGRSFAPSSTMTRVLDRTDPAGRYRISLLQDYDLLKFQSTDGQIVRYFAAILNRDAYCRVLYSRTGNAGTWVKD